MKLNIFVFLLIWHAVLCQRGPHKPPRFCSRRESALIAQQSKIAIKSQVDIKRIIKLEHHNRSNVTSYANKVFRDIKNAAILHAQDTQSKKCFIKLAVETKQVQWSNVVALKSCYSELKEHQHIVRVYYRALKDINRCSKKKQSCKDTRECCDRVQNNFDFENEFNVLVESMETCFREKSEKSRYGLNHIASKIDECYSTVSSTGNPSIIPSLETTSQAPNTGGVTGTVQATIAAGTSIAPGTNIVAVSTEATVTIQATDFPTVNN